MEGGNQQTTERELEILFTAALGRNLEQKELDLIYEITRGPAEKRVVFLELMQELTNKLRQLK